MRDNIKKLYYILFKSSVRLFIEKEIQWKYLICVVFVMNTGKLAKEKYLIHHHQNRLLYYI